MPVLDFFREFLYNHIRFVKTMTKTVVIRRKAKRAGAGGNRYEYFYNENHFQVAVQNTFMTHVVLMVKAE